MEQNKRRHLIVNGSLFKALLFVSLPLMLNNFINASYNFIDTIFVAQIGSLELASVALISPLNNMILAISAGISISGTALIGKAVGKEDFNEISVLVNHFVFIAIFLGLAITGSLFIIAETIMAFSGATASLIEAGSSYFKILILSTPIILMNAVYIAFKSGKGETDDIMKVHLISMIIKVAFTYYFIMILKKGIAYLGISTIIGQSIILMFTCYELFIKNKAMKLSIWHFSYNQGVFMEIVRTSVPVIVERMSVSYSFVMVNTNVLKFGENVLAAYGITNRINSLFFSTISGLGSGLATIISQNIGALNKDRIKKAIKYSMLLALVLSTFFGLGILYNKHIFAGILARSSQELHSHVIDAISTYSISIIPWAIFQVIIGIFIGFGKTKYNLGISLFRLYFLRVPCIVILTRIESLGAFSVWYAMILSNILTALMAWLFFKSRERYLYNSIEI